MEKGHSMIYGTINTDVYAYMRDCGQEFLHHQVITRWWENETATGFEWKHTVVRIARDGAIMPISEDEEWWDIYRQYMIDKPTSHAYERYFEGRIQLTDQHNWIVRHCIG